MLVAVLALGCGSADEPEGGKKRGQGFLRCAKPYDDGVREKFNLTPLTVERDGLSVTIRGIKRGQIVLGVLAGVVEPSTANLANIDFFLNEFRKTGVQAILVAGGVGLLDNQVTPILERLAQAPVPILVCPGAQESFDVFRRAVRQVRQKYPQILDMTRIRRVILGNINIVSIPGYYNPYYLKAGKRGCAYQKSDLEELTSLFDEARTTVILAPSPPLGRGAQAVDRGRGDVNLGDPALAELLRVNELRFGLFGYVYESGGHATLDDGATAVSEGIWHDSLYLQTGAVDAVPLSLIGQGRSVGMAHVVELSGKRARFRTVFAKTTRSQ